MSSIAASVFPKIALGAAAGIDERDVDAPLPQLEPERVGDGLHGELRRAVCAVEREHEAAADRPDVHEPTLALADQGQERLRHRDVPEQVDLELRAEVVHRLELERAGPHDAGVVHQTGDPTITHSLLDGLDRRRDASRRR